MKAYDLSRRGDRIRYIRKELLGLRNQEALADRLKVTRGSVGNWELGGDIGKENLLAISRISSVPPEWIEDRDGDDPLPRAAERPAHEEVDFEAPPTPDSAGVDEFDLRAGASYGGGYVIANLDGGREQVKAKWYFPERWLRDEMRLRVQSTDIVAIDGPSMLPDLAPGDRVLIDRSNTDPKQDAIFAIRDGDSVIVKHVQLIRGTDPPRIVCRSSNAQYQPFELILDGDSVAIIGRVAGRISRL